MRSIFQFIIYIFAAIGFVLLSVYVAIQLGWTKSSGIIDTQHDYFKNQLSAPIPHTEWSQSTEWSVLKEAILKDTDVINSAAERAEIQPRLIVAILIVEQLRLFHSNREIFKSIFAPLKILGNQSQFSWGVMGIKQDTARQIENNLKDRQSPWYLGKQFENLLDYSSTSTPTETDSKRFERLADEKSRYFSYLYTAIHLKELENQWSKAGFSIANKPEILATLFNIGFINSHPHADPVIGGAKIEIGSSTYSFGGLAGSFYYSDELLAEFPK